MDDVPVKSRAKLQALLNERSVLAYAFSWENLHKAVTLISESATSLDEAQISTILLQCVAAFSEDDCKELRAQINDRIADTFTDYDIATLLGVDPFGRPKDYILMNGTATSFSQQRAMDIAVSQYSIPAATIAEIFEKATNSKGYTTLQARDRKEREEKPKAKAKKGGR